MMRKILKLILPVFFLLFYAMASYLIYWGISEESFCISDSLQEIIGNVMLIGIMLIYLHFRKIDFRNMFRKSNISIKHISLILLCIPGIYLFINRLLVRLAEAGYFVYQPELAVLGEIKLFLFNAIIAVTIAPIVEELLFRLCMISSYQTKAGKIYGVIMSSLVFGYAHSGLIHRMSAVVVALVLGGIFLITDNIFFCILVHAGINLSVTIFGIICLKVNDINKVSISSSIIYVSNSILIITLTISTLAAFVLYHDRN